MNIFIRNLLPLVAACALAACSTVTVTTDYDHSTSFAKYKTYSLGPAAHGQTLSPTSEAALRDSLRTELAARGISEVPSGKADLAVVRHAFHQEKVSVQQYTDWGYGYGGWPYRYGYYSMWAGAPRTYTDVNQYTEGTLVLDFVDRHTNKLVFRGTATAVVEGPESNASKIQEAVRKIVAEMPIGATR
jgi:Domain of unknown function (DUF4136)